MGDGEPAGRHEAARRERGQPQLGGPALGLEAPLDDREGALGPGRRRPARAAGSGPAAGGRGAGLSMAIVTRTRSSPARSSRVVRTSHLDPTGPAPAFDARGQLVGAPHLEPAPHGPGLDDLVAHRERLVDEQRRRRAGTSCRCRRRRRRRPGGRSRRTPSRRTCRRRGRPRRAPHRCRAQVSVTVDRIVGQLDRPTPASRSRARRDRGQRRSRPRRLVTPDPHLAAPACSLPEGQQRPPHRWRHEGAARLARDRQQLRRRRAASMANARIPWHVLQLGHRHRGDLDRRGVHQQPLGGAGAAAAGCPRGTSSPGSRSSTSPPRVPGRRVHDHGVRRRRRWWRRAASTRPVGQALGDLAGLGVAVEDGVDDLVVRAGADRVVGARCG